GSSGERRVSLRGRPTPPPRVMPGPLRALLGPPLRPAWPLNAPPRPPPRLRRVPPLRVPFAPGPRPYVRQPRDCGPLRPPAAPLAAAPPRGFRRRLWHAPARPAALPARRAAGQLNLE